MQISFLEAQCMEANSVVVLYRFEIGSGRLLSYGIFTVRG